MGNRQMLCHLVLPTPLSQSLFCRRGKADVKVTGLLPGMWAELEPWSNLKAEDLPTLGPPLYPRSLGCPPPPKGRHRALHPLGKEVPVGWRKRLRGEFRDRALWPALGFPPLVKPLSYSRSTFLTYWHG